MKYICEVRINRPREEVLKYHYDDHHRFKWQQKFLECQVVKGEAFQKGTKSRLAYKNHEGILEMTETILVSDLPNRLQVMYEASHTVNLSDDSWIDEGLCTVWRKETVFHLTGLTKWVSLLWLRSFKSNTLKDMTAFKSFVEQEASPTQAH